MSIIRQLQILTSEQAKYKPLELHDVKLSLTKNINPNQNHNIFRVLVKHTNEHIGDINHSKVTGRFNTVNAIYPSHKQPHIKTDDIHKALTHIITSHNNATRIYESGG